MRARQESRNLDNMPQIVSRLLFRRQQNVSPLLGTPGRTLGLHSTGDDELKAAKKSLGRARGIHNPGGLAEEDQLAGHEDQ